MYKELNQINKLSGMEGKPVDLSQIFPPKIGADPHSEDNLVPTKNRSLGRNRDQEAVFEKLKSGIKMGSLEVQISHPPSPP